MREECYITSPTDDAYLQRTRKVPEGERLDEVRKKQKLTSASRKSLSLKRLFDAAYSIAGAASTSRSLYSFSYYYNTSTVRQYGVESTYYRVE